MKLLFVFLFMPFVAVGPIICATGETVSKSATPWTNPGNITASDGSYTTVTSASSDYLYAHNFDFSALPASAQIISFSIAYRESNTKNGSNYNLSFKLVDENGTLVGTQQNYPFSTANSFTGGNWPIGTDWGFIPTAAQFKDADFGVKIWYTSGTSETVSIDYVSMLVNYSIGGGFFQLMSNTN